MINVTSYYFCDQQVNIVESWNFQKWVSTEKSFEKAALKHSTAIHIEQIKLLRKYVYETFIKGIVTSV